MGKFDNEVYSQDEEWSKKGGDANNITRIISAKTKIRKHLRYWHYEPQCTLLITSLKNLTDYIETQLKHH